MNLDKRIGKESFNEILFSTYLSFVCGVFIFLKIYEQPYNNGWSLMLCILVSSVVCFILTHKIFNYFDNLAFDWVKKDNKAVRKTFIGFVMASILWYAIWWSAFYPGGFSPDSVNQYTQAMTNQYSDGQTVWHTLLFFTLPLKIHRSLGFIMGIQILLISLTIAYMCMTVFEFAGIRIAVVSLLYVILNPYYMVISLYPWKDVAFAIASCFTTTHLIRILYIKREITFFEAALMGVMLANISLFRHNGILFSIPLAIGIFMHTYKTHIKQSIVLVIVFFCFFVGVKGPLYLHLDVERPERKLEMLGVPLTIIGNAVKEDAEILDNKVLTYAYNIAEQEVWESRYVCGSFNSMKFSGVAKSGYVNEVPVSETLDVMFRCIREAPESSLRGFFSLTSLVFAVDDDAPKFNEFSPVIYPNDYGIVWDGNTFFLGLVNDYHWLVHNSILKHIGFSGLSILIMLFFILKGSDLRIVEDWKRIFLVGMPCFIYSFGTMLLLTGGDARFFEIDLLMCPLVCVFMISNNRNGRGQELCEVVG